MEINSLKILQSNAICGVYFLSKESEIVYIGVSSDIMFRISQHRVGWKDYSYSNGTHTENRKQFDTVYYFECDLDIALKLEKACIIEFAPEYNKQRLKGMKRDLIPKQYHVEKYITELMCNLESF